MQMTRGMRLPDAKHYVAGKLGVSPSDLSDAPTMHDVRGELGLGRISYGGAALYPDQAGAMEAKFRIAEVLDIPVNCVERFRTHARI